MQSARIELDRFDHAILRVLSAEGRISATMPASVSSSRKTTGSIGRMCKCSNALSLPVLTANRLTALINSLD